MQSFHSADSGHTSRPGRSVPKTLYSYFVRPIFYRLVVFLPILFSVYAVPGTANAGLISFVAGLLGASSESTVVYQSENSQTVPLLEAVRAIDPKASVGGGDITIVGDSALLPESGPLGTLADIEDLPASGSQISLYTVREGDSLSAIAKMFGVSVNTIIWANDIGSARALREGQTLIILPVSGVRYKIASGDTLASVAKRFSGDVKEIAQFNGLRIDEPLAVGDEVIIPDGERRSVPAPARGNTRIVRGSNAPDYAGYYMRPIGGGVKSQGLHGFNGIDLATYQGAAIFAAASGEVIISREGGWNGGYGNYVVISHPNGTQTLYSHNVSNAVVAGQKVTKGQVIGYVGSTGRSTGPHVHFEVRGAKNPF